MSSQLDQGALCKHGLNSKIAPLCSSSEIQQKKTKVDTILEVRRIDAFLLAIRDKKNFVKAWDFFSVPSSPNGKKKCAQLRWKSSRIMHSVYCYKPTTSKLSDLKQQQFITSCNSIHWLCSPAASLYRTDIWLAAQLWTGSARTHGLANLSLLVALHLSPPYTMIVQGNVWREWRL